MDSFEAKRRSVAALLVITYSLVIAKTPEWVYPSDIALFSKLGSVWDFVKKRGW